MHKVGNRTTYAKFLTPVSSGQDQQIGCSRHLSRLNLYIYTRLPNPEVTTTIERANDRLDSKAANRIICNPAWDGRTTGD